MALIRLQKISRRYQMGAETIHALREVSLEIQRGEYVAIMGPSGSGKSTLMNLIGCLDTPTGGEYELNGVQVSQMDDNQLAEIRNKEIGFIFQTFNLLPVLSAAENVEYPLLQRADISAAERRERVHDFLNVVGLADRMNNRPNQLSGGQRQRVAIARALAGSPRIVLADEPTANLDKKTGVEILRLMKRINHSMKTTFIFSTHDRRVVELADRLVQIEDGSIAALGIRREGDWLLARPPSDGPDD
jgi:putative ABC transport system ATP-binding protein